MGQKILKPILKWAGGKSQLLTEISNAYPDELGKTITRYVEPFVGGGAVFFDILSKYTLKEVYINDINPELINMYNAVRDHVDSLINILKQYQEEYLSLDIESRQKYYYKKRDCFNNSIENGTSKNSIESAALFIFLNRTCFNGLYRANKQGLFNVPPGKYVTPQICNEDNLKAVSAALKNVTILCGDYTKVIKYIDERTLVYLDPPYRPLKGKYNFTSYTEKTFNDSSQRELAGFIEDIDTRGAHIILSNSDPKNVDPEDDFFENLYADFDIQRIHAKRQINSNSNHRGYITELLIKNY